MAAVAAAADQAALVVAPVVPAADRVVQGDPAVLAARVDLEPAPVQDPVRVRALVPEARGRVAPMSATSHRWRVT